MRLKAIAKSGESKGEIRELLAMPIVVEELGIEGTTFHSDTMIASVGIATSLDVNVLADVDANLYDARRIDINSSAMRSKIKENLSDAIYNGTGFRYAPRCDLSKQDRRRYAASAAEDVADKVQHAVRKTFITKRVVNRVAQEHE